MMKFTSYSHIGKKQINEDFVKTSNNSFIVCDGVGGEVKGEIASKEIANWISDHLSDKSLDENLIRETIINSQTHLNSLIENQPELEGMATTLAAIFTANTGFYIAHIGDSRIYLVRPSKNIFWQTWDHSLVGNLVKNKEISREDGRKHPMNNRIFKAIKANFKSKTSQPEIHQITDLKKGDIIFIFSDGVSEAFADVELLELLAEANNTIHEKLSIIEARCSIDSFDNNTAIIAQLEKDDIPKATITPIEWINIESLHELENLDSVSPESTDFEKTSKPKRKWYNFFKPF
jgi:serine/threonine protein phosphatase PrpC